MSGALLALAGILHLGLTIVPSADAPAERLVTGQRVEYELAAGSVRGHVIELEAGQFVRLALVQDGLDTTATLLGPDGSRVDVDAAVGPFGREPLSLLAAAGGVYRLEVRATNAAAAGRYALEAEPPRTATAQDRIRKSAETALVEGAALVRQATIDSAKAAAERFDTAVREWRGLDDRAWELEALLQRGAARATAYEFARVLEDGRAAVPLARALANRRGEARALRLVGWGQTGLDDQDAAILTLGEVVALWRALGDRDQEAETLGALGWAHAYRGDLSEHVEIARQVREMSRGLGDPSREAWALMDLGGALANAEDLQQALDCFREARPMFAALGDRDSEAIAIQNAGAVHGTLGDQAGALAAFEQALIIFQATKNRQTEGTSYQSIGSIHAERSDWKKALDAFSKGLAIAREMGDRRREVHALLRMGWALNGLREYPQASSILQEALRLNAEVKDPGAESLALLHLAETNIATGHADEARLQLRRAVERARAEGSQDEAKAHRLLGRIARDAGALEEARAELEAALEAQEGIRRRVTSPRLRATFVASVRETHELYLDVLMGLHRQQPEQGFDARALEVSETGRARGLVDQLADGGLRIREGVDLALLDEERKVQDRLSAAVDRQLRLSQGAHTGEQAQAATRSVQTLTADWDAARARIRAKSPRYAALRDPPPTTVAEIRNAVLDADTQLLEYALGVKRSFAWVLSRDGLTAYELPARAAVEAVAREAYAQLSNPSPTAHTSDALARLSRMILGPAAKALTAKRLLIVPDGALHYVPFAALPDPDRDGELLVTRHEIVGAPSASVVALLRREMADRRAAPRTIAVLADPVFDAQDERLRGPRAARPAPAPSPGDELSIALRSAGVDGALPRLPFTRREANAILSLVPARERLEALDFDASRTTATDPSLAEYRFVHFATHGFLNSGHPDLSGIVLSLVGRDGTDARGFLTPTDVFNLHLNADMVVLSGCRTALGEELRGEGLVGLSRGFMYAGTPRVVSSLWRVDDAATAELMKRFYRGILQQGLPPSAALRAAQLDLMRRSRFRDPFYWAAFQLQGEWR